MKRKIIIDTDPGCDDALAIMLAVKSCMFDILAITTVAGNSSIENTTRNARYILDLLGRNDIPIYSGSEKPLVGDLVKAVVHGKSGLGEIYPKNSANMNNMGVEKIIELVENNPGDITLVGLGPLTNIAKAIKYSPESMKKLKEIIIMGGAIRDPGNKSRVAEFNIFVDPEAADIVFKFPVKKTIIPLDACNDIKMQLKDFKKITNNKLRESILKMMRPYILNIFEDEGADAALVYDALTIYYLINPNAGVVKNYDIRIETCGKLTKGMTVADLRKKCENENIIGVVEKINRESFVRDFINCLSEKEMLLKDRNGNE